MVRIDPKTKQILDKYGSKLADNYQSAMDAPSRGTFTKDYSTFRDEAVFQKNTFYERACKFAGSIINLAPSKEEQKRKLAESIEVAHLSITPAQAYTLSILVMFGFILLALMIGFITFAFGSFSFMLVIILMGMGVFSLIPLSSMPHHLAQKHRLQSSNQMVLCILYIVIYMRHTSNLEHAIKFAGEHIGNPLALDLRKIYWDAETNKYSTIQESLTHYLEGWKDHNLAFVESFQLGFLYFFDLSFFDLFLINSSTSSFVTKFNGFHMLIYFSKTFSSSFLAKSCNSFTILFIVSFNKFMESFISVISSLRIFVSLLTFL